MVDTYLGELVQRIGIIRRAIHQEPETAFTELRTSAMVSLQLEALGLQVYRVLEKQALSEC